MQGNSYALVSIRLPSRCISQGSADEFGSLCTEACVRYSFRCLSPPTASLVMSQPIIHFERMQAVFWHLQEVHCPSEPEFQAILGARWDVTGITRKSYWQLAWQCSCCTAQVVWMLLLSKSAGAKGLGFLIWMICQQLETTQNVIWIRLVSHATAQYAAFTSNSWPEQRSASSPVAAHLICSQTRMSIISCPIQSRQLI